MKTVRFLALLVLTALTAAAQNQAAPADAQQAATTTAAAAVAATRQEPAAPDFLEHLVDSVLALFDVRSSENTVTHYVVAALFLIIAVLLRRVVTNIIFHYLKKLASKTETTLDDKLFPAMEQPTATFIMVTGIFAALKVLKLSESTDHYLSAGSTVAFSLVIFWGLLRAFDAVLDHAHEIARERQMGIAAFMPWIKKTLVAVFVILGGLLIIQSLGYNVSTILQGLGIGGLAFALAAQDTIANLFGSIVVATDQPFKLGEAVRIGGHEGVVEDIGLRSTKLRTPQRNLIVIPNKMVASEAIVNNARFIGRRVEQLFGLTYDTTADQLEAVVGDIRKIVESEPDVDRSSVHVYFRDFSASSLDIWCAYNLTNPDFANHMKVRQRVNFAIMHAIERRGLEFAYPTTTMHIASTPDGGTPPALQN